MPPIYRRTKTAHNEVVRSSHSAQGAGRKKSRATVLPRWMVEAAITQKIEKLKDDLVDVVGTARRRQTDEGSSAAAPSASFRGASSRS
mmetsp:Transcript_31604/g.66517  ORF Transcript_31604/g.66517 Transcript_31604/m.66517 type:complete len:88 (-) Transcript_31604:500-763(-)